MLNFLWPSSSTKRADGTSEPWPLDKRLLSWSKRDDLTIRDAVNGIFVTGISGGGKSSGPLKTIACAQLAAGFGGIFHSVKISDAETALEWCRQTGRLGDVVMFGPKHPARFNFLDYEYQRPGEGAGLTDNIVNLLLNVAEIRDRKSGNGGGGGENAEFFANAKLQILRVTVDVLARAKGRVSVPDIYKMITSAPTSKDEFNSPDWRRTSFCWECMLQAVQRRNAGTVDEFKSDLELAGTYWCDEFPMLSDRTRSSIVSSVTGTLDALHRGYLRRLFCEETNFTPEALADGKILIHTMSVKEFGEVGAMAQVILKFSAQKAIERRDVRTSPRPIFMILDEFQALITSADSSFATTCRSARASFFLLTQNLPTVYAALGGSDKAKQEVNSLIGNCNLKILCANSDPETTRWAAEMVGRTRQYTMSSSTQRNSVYGMNSLLGCGPPPQTTAGINQIFEYELQPARFGQLRTGGPENNYCVDTILYKTGKAFKNTGRNWMAVTFSQK